MTPEEACAVVDRIAWDDNRPVYGQLALAARTLRQALAEAMKVVEAARDLLDELETTGDVPSAEKQDELIVALAALEKQP